ncbi:hypothetical protein PR202_gb17687 [Eleusine coracana subsp. coracana]|uniref:Uncharacterized protein n=1 Tax=Eleusine coracana subsp. coracana TaxID=191504 RepID=A0AAV5F5E6_ELECO|nr:hypothetical protein PR202_gb17687 [Eleusine coracana subsp. coracana]
MSSLVERLRVRSERRPLYTLDESDDDLPPRDGAGKGKDRQNDVPVERIKRKDVFPLVHAILTVYAALQISVSPLTEMEKILDCEMQPEDANSSESDSKNTKRYLIKWKGLSHIHCSWIPEKEYLEAAKTHPRLKTRLNNFHRQMDLMDKSDDDCAAIRPEWTTVDRILATRKSSIGEREYYVKWKELSYEECTWESESDISAFRTEIERFNEIQSRLKSSGDRGKNPRDGRKFKESPKFLSGGTLHPYQLEGLNFLRYSWHKNKPVILGDEMGLGKTIQSIAFLASLFEDKFGPHLVVAPLSTLRNWEREFATWAPQMNVVVDEGHRLKNKDSKLFGQLKDYNTKHRVLLTGTPVQNNLDELFMLMHFLEGESFGSISDLQEEFKDINQDKQIEKLHGMLKPHLLRNEPDSEPANPEEGLRRLLDASGKMQLLDKMMVKLKEQGHRVLIYSQFQHMLDLLEDYLSYRKWSYERIDGKIAGAERQIRIDRFNAKHSTRFCFLLSTRAGGLGINLATADTVIIYDSDWNPHADLQAMARAHRLGQTNKVMIYRLVSRGTIEERMMQLTKKKMILEHLVVGRLTKASNVNQEELDDIIRYGSKELFEDENDEAGKSRQIHYDDAAIERLLDRDQADEEECLEEDDDDDFMKGFKVANFEYIDEEKAKEEARRKAAAEAANAAKAGYWEELLKDKYDVQKVEEHTTMGKGKRSRKQG